uniref:Uncharacterized protein n=1 Tax=Vespula pensylvanica TaxID=30213 RepID=A0A834PDD1_VESPE|nr:hypothetical protein H0235_004133 [Vespula pensylvanica]
MQTCLSGRSPPLNRRLLHAGMRKLGKPSQEENEVISQSTLVLIVVTNSEKMAARSEGNCMGREVDAKEMKQLAKVAANEA